MITIQESLQMPTVAEMVASDYRKAHVFSQFGIDFCCGGKKPVSQVCAEKNVDLATLEQALMQVDATSAGSGIHWDFLSWEKPFLIDFIVNAHHGYVRAQIPKLLAYGAKVARVHGDGAPETIEIHQLFQTLAAELLQHMDKEENVLFPWIKRLHAGVTEGNPPFSIENPIEVLENEHDEAGAIMHRIQALSNNFTPPEWGCNTFRVWYASLKEFEDDLHLHVHLENNILFKL
ncbi:MAG: iron-sulfur cluster repair di-iron protein [Saprospiraceae bacterium]|nr:iron-sulfur cluster repair di-iron protein [Saprospiraceae bacterium]